MPVKCGRRLDSLGAEGKRCGWGPEKVGSRWGLDTGKLPTPNPRSLGSATGPGRGAASPLRLLASPPRRAWKGSQGGGRVRRLPLPMHTRGPLPPGAAGRNDPRTRRRGDGEEGRRAPQVASPRCLKFAVDEGAGSVLPPPPARSPQPRLLPRRVLSPLPPRLPPLSGPGSPLLSPSLPVPERPPLPPSALDLRHDVSGK